MIVDTTLVIDFLRKKVEAISFLDKLYAAGDLWTHPAVVAETLQGARNRREQDQIDALFARFHLVDVQPFDLADSLVRLRQFSLSHSVGWHDCLIAATAHRLDHGIATINDRDFACFGDIRVVRPY